MKDKPNIIFMGTPEFAVPTLVKLNSVYGLKAVVTVPDKSKGRNRKVLPSDVKKKALELNIPVLQPERLKDENFIEELKTFNPDIIVVLAFRILPEEIYSLAKIATFNIHASLLPKYRGAAPINWAIINGETISGLTSFILEKKVDTGKILMQNSIKIPAGFTAGDLHNELMPLAAEMAVDTCNLLLSGEYKPYFQDDTQATPAPKIFPEFCRISWNQHAQTLANFINGLSPHPGAWSILDGQRYKIHRVVYSACGSGKQGEYNIENNTFSVYCSKGIISILEIQAPGRKKVQINEFIRGFRGDKRGEFQ